MTNNGRTDLLKPGERLDDLQIGGLELIQNPSGFCFGVDAVFLSDFVKVKPGRRCSIWVRETESFQFCYRQKPVEKSLPVLRFRKILQIWQGGAWHTIISKTGLKL